MPPALASELGSLGALDISSSLGAAYIGNLSVAMLFVLTSVQMRAYFKHSRDDSPLIRYSVLALWFIDTLHFVLATHSVYTVVIGSVKSHSAALSVSWSGGVGMSVAGVSDLMVTLIFAYRIWKFSGHQRAVQAIVTAVVLGGFAVLAGDIAMNVIAMRNGTTTVSFSPPWLWCATFGLRAAVDVLLATTLSSMLYACSESATRTKSVIQLIVAYSIGTCALTSVCTLLAVAFYVLLQHTFIAFVMALVLPKLLLNALLATLNSRSFMRSILERERLRSITLNLDHGEEALPAHKKRLEQSIVAAAVPNSGGAPTA